MDGWVVRVHVKKASNLPCQRHLSRHGDVLLHRFVECKGQQRRDDSAASTGPIFWSGSLVSTCSHVRVCVCVCVCVCVACKHEPMNHAVWAGLGVGRGSPLGHGDAHATN